MRYTYGIMDRRKILLYKPQLFLKDKNLLIFPGEDFQKWHYDIKEYIDGIYQIDSLEMKEGNSISITELNLAMGMLKSIEEEFEQLFDCEKISSSSHHYISTLNRKYKKQRSSYTCDMERCDMQIPVITEDIKNKNLMETIYKVNKNFSHALKNSKGSKDLG